MKTRTITGVLLAIILIPCIYFGGYFILGLTIFLSAVASYEFFKMLEKKQGTFKLKYIMPIINIGLVLLSYFAKEYFNSILLVVSTILLTLPIVNSKTNSDTILSCIFSLFYTCISFICLLNLRLFQTTMNEFEGAFIILYLVITTMLTDVFAYFVGIKFGKHKLAPLISPKKSVEGSIGGSVFGTIFGTLSLAFFQSIGEFKLINVENQIFNILILVLITFVITIIGQVGDLVASKLKRDNEIKDFGNIFPGHGGVLDRFDSLIATSIILFAILGLFI